MVRTIAIWLALFAAACGGGARSVRRCSNSPDVPCLTGEECSYDTARECEMCRCETPYGVDEHQVDPIGPASPE